MASSSQSGSGPTPRKVKRTNEEEELGLTCEDSENSEYDNETHHALEAIDKCQNEIDSLNEKASEEIINVEVKYNGLRKPCYRNRQEFIKKIPNFWVVAMVNHPQISNLIDEDEEDCLHFVSKLEVEEFDDVKSGFRITFCFDENPFFENDVLVKEFRMDTVAVPKSTSTEIRWKENMNLEKKRKDEISGGRKRDLNRRTFFTWFSDNSEPESDDIGDIFKDDFWPNPLQYYLNPDDIDNETEEEADSEEEEDEPHISDEEDIEDVGE